MSKTIGWRLGRRPKEPKTSRQLVCLIVLNIGKAPKGATDDILGLFFVDTQVALPVTLKV